MLEDMILGPLIAILGPYTFFFFILKIRDNPEKLWKVLNLVVSFIFVEPGFMLFDLVMFPCKKS